MEYQQLIDSLTPDVVARLRRGVETGRWPDGRPLTPEQREHSLQAIIAWDERHAAAEQRVGFIDKGRKGRNSRNEQDPGRDTLRWVADDEEGE
jgi:uncharacterized protein YeaC (DUF1315 family)